MIKKKTELLLSLLYAGENNFNDDNQQSVSIVGITRLEKLLFLLKNDEGFLANVSEENNINYVPFKMGPWSNDVYDEIDFLDSLGLIEKDISKSTIPSDTAHDDELIDNMVLDKYQKNLNIPNEQTEIFKLSEKGKKKALEIWKTLTSEERKKIVSVKQKFNKINLKQFLLYVYKKYPEYTVESEIKEYLGIN